MAAAITLVTHAQLEEFLKEAEKKGQQTMVLNADGTNVAVVVEDPEPKPKSKTEPEPEPKAKQTSTHKGLIETFKEHHRG